MRMKTFISTVLAAITFVATLHAGEPKGLQDARQAYKAIKNPTEADRVHYLTQLVRMREKLTRADSAAMDAIDAEIIRHPMPASTSAAQLKKALVGRWMSPRRPYFYHADGTMAANEDTREANVGDWAIKGNKFFENIRDDQADPGTVIYLLNETDFVHGAHAPLFYLRRGTAFPWKL